MLFSLFGSLRGDVLFAKTGDLCGWFELLTVWVCTVQGIPVIKSSFLAYIIGHPSWADARRCELLLILESGKHCLRRALMMAWIYIKMGEGPEKEGSDQACRPLLKNIIYRYITAISYDEKMDR